MWSGVDARGQDMTPVRDYNQGLIIFFMVLVIFLCMLFLNLFVGIIIEAFNSEKETLSHNHLLKFEENQWI